MIDCIIILILICLPFICGFTYKMGQSSILRIVSERDRIIGQKTEILNGYRITLKYIAFPKTEEETGNAKQIAQAVLRAFGD